MSLFLSGEKGLTRGSRKITITDMLWTLIVILVVLWLLGFSVFHVAGGLIHLLLVIALIVLVIKLMTSRRV
jgi:Family of unknown function (DUF5670)